MRAPRVSVAVLTGPCELLLASELHGFNRAQQPASPLVILSAAKDLLCFSEMSGRGRRMTPVWENVR